MYICNKTAKLSLVIALFGVSLLFANGVLAVSGTDYVRVERCEKLGNDVKIYQDGQWLVKGSGCQEMKGGTRLFNYSCASDNLYKVEWQDNCTMLKYPELFLLGTDSAVGLGNIAVGNNGEFTRDNFHSFEVYSVRQDVEIKKMVFETLDLAGLPTAKADAVLKKVIVTDNAFVIIGEGTVVNGKAEIKFFQKQILHRNVPIFLRIGLVLNPISDVSLSGKFIRLRLKTLEAVEACTGAYTKITIKNPTSDGWIVRKSVPGMSIANHIYDKLVYGNQYLLRVAISADAAGDISWKALKFNIKGNIGGYPLNNLSSQSKLIKFVNEKGQGLSNFIVLNEDGTELADGAYTWKVYYNPRTESAEILIILRTEERIPTGKNWEYKEYNLKAFLNVEPKVGDKINTEILNGTDTRTIFPNKIITGSVDEVDGVVGDGIKMLSNETASPYSFLWSDLSVLKHEQGIFSGETYKDWTNESWTAIQTGHILANY